ncbi:porin [Neisseria dentiae]|uniref:porin n=2 Tax=Neisseria dentiae TaxID=194197 RepID=UPI0035A0BA54
MKNSLLHYACNTIAIYQAIIYYFEIDNYYYFQNMKNKIIFALLAALPIGAAAESAIYGQIRNSVSTGQVKIKGTAGTEKSATATTINDHSSRIGFKGSEKLGGNLKAIWQVESRIGMLEGNGRWASRDTFVGLDGSFGKLRVGRISNPLNAMDKHDFWLAQSPALGLKMNTRTAKRKVSARYDTPEFGGLTAGIQYTPRDNANPSDAGIHAQPSREELDAGLDYKNKTSGVYAQLGYNIKKNSHTRNGSLKDGHAVRLAAGYDGKKLFIGGALQHTRGFENGNQYLGYFTDGFNTYNGFTVNSDPAKAEGVKATDAAISASYKTGNWVPKISYAHGWPAKGLQSGSVLVDKFDQVIIGADYVFSKRTSLRNQIGHIRTGNKTRLGNGHTGRVEQTAAQIALHHRF